MVVLGKKSSASGIKQRAERKNTQFLARIGKDDLRVRFLEEPDSWVEYEEHYSEKTKYVPCGKPGDLDCPLCDSQVEKEARTSVRYVANVLDVKKGQVVPLKMPLSLANKLIERFERRGTVMDRDYTLMKMGSGLDTEYDLEAEERTNVDVTRYTESFHDATAILGSMYTDVWGEAAAKPQVIGAGKAPLNGEQESDAGTTRPDADDPAPFEPAPQDGEFVTEEQLRQMKLPQLRAIAEQLSVDLDGVDNVTEAVEFILATAK